MSNYKGITPAPDPDSTPEIGAPINTRSDGRPRPIQEVVAKFTAVLDKQGHWLVVQPNEEVDFVTEREPTHFDFLSAAAQITSEITASNAANISIQMQMQLAEQMAQRAEAQRIGNMIGDPNNLKSGGIDLSKVRR